MARASTGLLPARPILAFSAVLKLRAQSVQIVLLGYALALAPVASGLLGAAVRERVLSPRITSDDVIPRFERVRKEVQKLRYIIART